MNKKEFIETLYSTGHFESKKETKEFVDIFLSTLKKNILNEEKVQFSKFGTFSLTESSRKRYIFEKEEVGNTISKDIKFKTSEYLKEEIRG